VEAVLACLEGGVEAQVYASGVAAAGAVFETVNAGQHILAPNMMYYGLKEWLVRISEKRSIGLDFVDITRPDAVRQKIRTLRPKLGGVPGAFEAWLLLRGMRTLSIRYERASENAMRIAQHFSGHPKVEPVLYPGLEEHPGHSIACKQMTGGFGGMLSLCVQGGEAEARRFVTGLKLVLTATSLGGVESLAEHRKTIEGPKSLVPDNLIRFSIGIENADDLIDDLEQAFQRI